MNNRLLIAVSAAILTVSGGAMLHAQDVVAPRDALTQAPAAVRAGNYVLDPAHSKVSWSVSHLGFSTYLGQFAGAEGTLRIDPRRPAAGALSVQVKTDSVGTLSNELDTHLKSADFLDVAKFPEARFQSTAIRLTGPRTADLSGRLTLHGVTRPVVIRATFNQAGVNPIDKKYSIGFDGTASIRRSDYGITTYVPGIGDQVTLQLAAEFKAAA